MACLPLAGRWWLMAAVMAPLTAAAEGRPSESHEKAAMNRELAANPSKAQPASASLAPDGVSPAGAKGVAAKDAAGELKQRPKAASQESSPGDAEDAADSPDLPDSKADSSKAPKRAADVLSTGGGDKTGASSQAISVPGGAGTLGGMGESFSAQLSTGVVSFSVPIALPVARGSARPSLALRYSSSSGWGIAGLGWDVGVPYISRQTDRGTPHYGDQADYFDDQDHFVFNGGQELIPICTVAGSDAAPTCSGALPGEKMPPWSLGSQYFRPRVEGSFQRFFWSPDHQTWRVQDKSGLTMEFGVPLDASNDRSGIQANPAQPTQIARWSLVRQYDAQGGANPASASIKPTPVNVVIYRYDAVNGPGELLTDIYDTSPAANPTTTDLSTFAHHTHLSYEARPDVTVSYRMGFAVERRYRLARIDTTSSTFNYGTTRKRQQLSRYHFSYLAGLNASLLERVQVEGRCGGSEDSLTSAPSEGVDGLLAASNCPRTPPIAFAYTHVDAYTSDGQLGGTPIPGFEGFDERVRLLQNSPDRSVSGDNADFFDLNRDGLPDFLVTDPGVYGDGFGQFLNSPAGIANSFSKPGNLPVFGIDGATAGNLRLSNPNVAVLDADGDGVVDLLHAPAAKTYAVYSLGAAGWNGRRVSTADQQDLKIDFGRDALSTRVLDVNGDGLVDVVVTTGTEIQTFLALGREHGGRDQFGTAIRRGANKADISTEPIRACLPWSGSAVSFGDPEIVLGDLNGDGLQDIVRLQHGQIRYWPGRGNGMWGTGTLSGCDGRSFAPNTDVAMTESPTYSDLNAKSLRVDDVNGDGLDDLIQVRSNAVDVWLNVNGVSWTPRHIIEGTPASPAFSNQVRLLDINGSGTRDLVWGSADNFQYIDLQGGKRPWLLSRIDHELGKTTDIEYSTSTAEMLAAESVGGACAADGWQGPWCSKMPIVVQVVKRTTERDNFNFMGLSSNSIVTEYEYRDPVYDGRQREFRGFRRGRTKLLGDATSPTSYAESRFLLGECVDETVDGDDDCADFSQDNPREALKGLQVLGESYDAAGVYQSTTATAYRLRKLYTGRDGRQVRHAFQVAQRNTLYDSFAGAAVGGSTVAFNAIEIETSPDAAFNPIANPTSEPVGLTKESITVPVRSTVGTATIETRSQVDYFGNQQVALGLGCTSGQACPVAATGLDSNEAIYVFTIPGYAAGDETGWLHRTVESYTKGSVRTQVRARTLSQFDSKGSLKVVQKELQGTVALDRRHRTLTGASVVAAAPTGASVDGLITSVQQTYDSFGNATKIVGANGRCRMIGYEASNTTGYAQLPTTETTYSGQNCTGTALTRASAYDRGLGKPTVVTEPSGQATLVAYDELGRLASIQEPRPSGTGTPLASTTLIYSLPIVGRPYSTIETRKQDSANVDTAGYLWQVDVIDGMGRTRLSRQEADNVAGLDAGSAIHSGVVVFNAKGQVARSYLAQFANAAATDPLPNTVSGPFRRVEYDAFGRVSRMFDLDTGAAGVQTVRNDYHALSQDVWDSADLGLDTNQAHQGTYASITKDAFGRTIVTAERVLSGAVLDTREVRTKYLTTGEPEVVTRVHVGSADAPVVRWMRYDTLGRLVLNVDAHTTLNFNADPTTNATPSANGLRAWRYAYDDAGDVVGTSDARGCGTNYTFDAMGRVISEDYSPCEAAHNAYSPPNFTTHAGIEVFYQYDSIPTSFSSVVGVPAGSGGSGLPVGYSPSDPNLLGRLAAVYDRAALDLPTYDGRGRITRRDRRLADPDPTVVDPRLRYRGRWYSTTTGYDAANRVVLQSTGAVSPELLVASASNLQVDYSSRGIVKRVYGSYGDLIKSVKRSADGLLEQAVYGDAASTTLSETYNLRRWLATSQATRAIPSLWSSPPANYLPAPNLSPSSPTSFQMILQDASFSYDVVGNPTAITDFRTAAEWPVGAKPVSLTAQYDDLYRVKQVDYAYAGGGDTFVSPFAPERAGVTDPRQSSNFPTHLLPSQRMKQQTYDYDWLGSIVSADDDQHAMWDRGVGPESTYASTGMPYRWKNAGDLAVPTWPGSGTAQALAYDEAGNLLDLQTTKVGTCSNGASSCTVRFTYAYDELGRLNRGTRIEGGVTKADLRSTYDHSDNRVIKGDYSVAQRNFTVYLFSTVELRRAAYDSAAGEFTRDAATETVFLNVAGEGLGRVSYEGAADGEPRIGGSRLHVLLTLGDHLGSTSLVIDKATGELVERRSYQAYGSVESDYRPDRWKGFREDYGFTGKEEDIEVGLQYFGKRFLNPYLGRFVTPDPLAVHLLRADLNLYAYVSGQTLRATDPLGLAPEGGAPSVSGAPQPSPELGSRGNGPVANSAPDVTEAENAEALFKHISDKAVAYAQQKMMDTIATLAKNSKGQSDVVQVRVAYSTSIGPIKVDVSVSVRGTLIIGKNGPDIRGSVEAGISAETPGLKAYGNLRGRVEGSVSLTRSLKETTVNVKLAGMARVGPDFKEAGIKVQATGDAGFSANWKSSIGKPGSKVELAAFARFQIHIGPESGRWGIRHSDRVVVPMHSWHLESNLAEMFGAHGPGWTKESGYGGEDCACSRSVAPEDNHEALEH